MPRASSPVSVYTVSSSDSDDYAPSDTPPSKKRRISHAKSRTANGVGLKAKQAVAGATVKSGKAEQAGKGGKAAVMDVEDAASCISRPHAAAYHLTGRVQEVQEALLSWFEDVRWVSLPGLGVATWTRHIRLETLPDGGMG
jgi:A/G-specific adenine glycosylase